MNPTIPFPEYVALSDGRRVEVRFPIALELRAVAALAPADRFVVLAERCAGISGLDEIALTDSDRLAIGAVALSIWSAPATSS